MPVYLCHSNDEHIQFRILEDDCEVVKKKDEWMERWEKNKANKDKKAPNLIHEPFATDGRELYEFREPYYKHLLETRGDHQAPPD